jgi:hypothetical protein
MADKKNRPGRAMGLMWPLAEKLGLSKKPSKEIDDDFLKTAAERACEAYSAERHNIEAAYEDLEYLAGNQWPDYARQQREHEQRPMLTFNRLPQFVQQVTGDIDLNKPSTKIVPVDAHASEQVAELLKGMIRYIKNRSEAKKAANKPPDEPDSKVSKDG